MATFAEQIVCCVTLHAMRSSVVLDPISSCFTAPSASVIGRSLSAQTPKKLIRLQH